jgi:membrane protein YqaA with SNARE-associated domain
VLKVRFSIFFLLVSVSKISRYVFILYLASFF